MSDIRQMIDFLHVSDWIQLTVSNELTECQPTESNLTICLHDGRLMSWLPESDTEVISASVGLQYRE